MSVWQIASAVLLLAPFAWMLGKILGVLRSIHKELVKIRLATVSLHDRVVPEALMQKWERMLRR